MGARLPHRRWLSASVELVCVLTLLALLGSVGTFRTQMYPLGLDAGMRNLSCVLNTSAQKNVKSKTVVTPWEVTGGEKGQAVDYDAVIDKFGCSRINETLMQRLETLAGCNAPPFIRRGLALSHRDLDKLLNAVEAQRRVSGPNMAGFYVYTGRGASSASLHLGHMIPFTLALWLQKTFQVPVVIQLTDDEKFLWKSLSLSEASDLAWENAKDIIALGFDRNLTYIFRNTDAIQWLYPSILKIQKHLTFSQVAATLGLTRSDSVGKAAFPALQAAPAFCTSFPQKLFPTNNHQLSCLVPCAIDQDPFFRLARDLAPRLGSPKPVLLHTRFLPALQGPSTKASSSEGSSAIFLDDSPKEIKRKFNRLALSGGQDTAELQRTYGADLSRDMAYQYLRYFHPNDTWISTVGEMYAKGDLLTGEVKIFAIKYFNELLASFQQERKKVSDRDVAEFMALRSIG